MNPFAVIGSATVLIPNFLNCQASFLLLCRLTVLFHSNSHYGLKDTMAYFCGVSTD